MKYLRPLMIGTFVVLLFLLGLSGWFLYRDSQQSEENVAATNSDEVAAVENGADDVAVETAVSTEPIATDESAGPLPAPVIQEFPTVTPLPTAVPTDTPIPTATAVPPTETAVPPTNLPPPPPPVATAVPPTSTAIPATAVPAGPQPGNVNGLVGTLFTVLTDRSNFGVNGMVWFEFTVQNTAGSDIPYNTLGVMPRKNGADFPQWAKASWGGPNASIKLGGLNWKDWIGIPEAGDYTLRLVVCFDGHDACKNGNGTYHTLSNEVAVTIR